MCGLQQTSASHSRCSVNQQSCVCLMSQLSFKCMYDKNCFHYTAPQGPFLSEHKLDMCSYTHTHRHTLVHVLTQSLTFCGHAPKATVDLCEQPFPKNLLFPYGSYTLAHWPKQHGECLCEFFSITA